MQKLCCLVNPYMQCINCHDKSCDNGWFCRECCKTHMKDGGFWVTQPSFVGKFPVREDIECGTDLF